MCLMNGLRRGSPLGAGRSCGALRPASDSSRPHHQVVALPAAASERATGPPDGADPPEREASERSLVQTMGDALINDSSLHGCGWHSSREGARQRYPGRAPAPYQLECTIRLVSLGAICGPRCVPG